MSSPYSIVPVEACMDSRLTKMQLRVLIALLSFRAKNTDTVWPKREQISNRCGYDKRVITRVTTQLVELGWLEKVGKGGFSKSCEYRITVPDLVTVDSRETVTDPVTVNEEKDVELKAGNGNQSGNGNQFGNGNQTSANNGNQFGASTVTSSVTRNKQTNNKPITDHSYLPRLDFSQWPEIPSEQLWKDFKKIRTARRAPITQTVINKIGRELVKAVGTFSVNECFEMVINANWQSYEFEWHLNKERKNATSSENTKLSRSDKTDADEAAYLRSLGIDPTASGVDGESMVKPETQAISS
jgi:hypothetical protein